MIRVGDAAPAAIYVGDTPVQAVYVGDTLVWPEGEPPAPAATRAKLQFDPLERVLTVTTVEGTYGYNGYVWTEETGNLEVTD